MQRKKCLFYYQQPSEHNNTAEQSDKLQQLCIYKNYSYKANFLIRDNSTIAQNKRPFTDGEFVKKCMMTVVEMYLRGKQNCFQVSVFQLEPYLRCLRT